MDSKFDIYKVVSSLYKREFWIISAFVSSISLSVSIPSVITIKERSVSAFVSHCTQYIWKGGEGYTEVAEGEGQYDNIYDTHYSHLNQFKFKIFVTFFRVNTY